MRFAVFPLNNPIGEDPNRALQIFQDGTAVVQNGTLRQESVWHRFVGLPPEQMPRLGKELIDLAHNLPPFFLFHAVMIVRDGTVAPNATYVCGLPAELAECCDRLPPRAASNHSASFTRPMAESPRGARKKRERVCSAENYYSFLQSPATRASGNG
jgi:hypothetical protein